MWGYRLLINTANIPERVINGNGTTIMWDVSVITDQTILANRPHIVLHNKEVKTHTDQYSHTDDSNINTKEIEKLSKYKDLKIEVSRMWKVRTEIVPLITGALGTIEKGLDQNLQILPGHVLDIELQKITLMSTEHISHKVLG